MSELISQMKIDDDEYSIRATEHALKRMKQRGVDKYVVAGTVLSLGKDKILEKKKQDADVAVIDKNKGISVVFGFVKNRIRVITVMRKTDIYVKDKTTLVEL